MKKKEVVLLIVLILFSVESYAHTGKKNWGYIYGYPPHSKETLKCFDICIEITDFKNDDDEQKLVGCYANRCDCDIEDKTFDLHCFKDYPHFDGVSFTPTENHGE